MRSAERSGSACRAHECAASASIALESVITPAIVLAIAITRLALNASSTVLRLSDAIVAAYPALRCVLMAVGHTGEAAVLVASNRGPLSYVADEYGRLTARRGGGGMISALAGHEQPITWVCAALTDGDRAAVRAAPDGLLLAPADGRLLRHAGGADARSGPGHL